MQKPAPKTLIHLIAWVVALTGLLIGLSLLEKSTNLVEQFELTLFDLRTLSRTQETPASDDIVMVSFGETTQFQVSQDWAQPFGISPTSLPRNQLAKVVQFAHEQGAKAIILDIRFTKASTANDPALLAAIKEAGNVYFVTQFNQTMESLQGFIVSEEEEAWDSNNVKQLILFNALTSLVHRHYSPLYLSPVVPVEPEQVIMSSIPNIWNLDPSIQQTLMTLQLANKQLNQSPQANYSTATLESKKFNQTIAGLTPFGYLQQICRDKFSFGLSPEVRQAIQQTAIHIDYPFGSWPAGDLKAYTFCSSSPIHPPFIEAAKDFAISNVYFSSEKGKLRTFPAMVRGLDDKDYFYASPHVAKDILGIKHFSYQGDTFQFGDRTIPLINQNAILINWRNPTVSTSRHYRAGELEILANWAPKLVQQLENLSFQPISTSQELLQNLQLLYGHYQGDFGQRPLPAVVPYFEELNELNRIPEAVPNPLLSPKTGQYTMALIQKFWPHVQAHYWHHQATSLPVLTYLPAESWVLEQSYTQWKEQWEEGFFQDLPPLTNTALQKRMLNAGNFYRSLPAFEVVAWKDRSKSWYQDHFPSPRITNIPGIAASGPLDLTNKIVIYGDYLTDKHATPLSSTTYGPEILATVLDSMLHDKDFIWQFPPKWDWTLKLLLALAMIYAVLRMRNLSDGVVLAMVFIALYWIVAFQVFNSYGWWVPIVSPTLAAILTIIGALGYKYYIQDRESRQLASAMSNYLSPQLMDAILEDPENAMETLKGSKRVLTVLFSDLRGFTSTFENADPMLMVEQLNEYLDTMTRIILEHKGCHDKYIGDAIMAIFGAPVEFEDHANMACQAAIAMEEALEQLNRKWESEGKTPLKQSIGISTGLMFVGNFGSEHIKNFTVMGSVVNLGARLEAYTRQVNVPIIISETTQEHIQDYGEYQCKSLGTIQVKGFSEPVQAFSLVLEPDPPSDSNPSPPQEDSQQGSNPTSQPV